jgi:hypothetical protein
MTNDKVLRAAEQGNYQALKMLTQNNFKYAVNQNQNSDLKKLSTFYMKETLPSKNRAD